MTTLATLTLAHAAPLPAVLTSANVLAMTAGLAAEGGPASGRARAMLSGETAVTFYGPDGRAVATMTRPRMYGDAAANPDAAGLFRLNATDGRLVAVFASVPTLAKVRDALCAYIRPVDRAAIEDATDSALREEEGDALAAVTRNHETAAAASFDTFRASALCRAIRAARRLAMAREELARRAAPACRDCGEELDKEAAPHGQCWNCCYAVPARPEELTEEDSALIRRVMRRAAVPSPTIRSKEELARMAEAPGLAGELAREGLAAVYVPRAADSGGFPLYAFREDAKGRRRAYDAEELDSMAYGPALAGLV